MQEIIEKYFSISHDASASLIITLITFILGYILTGCFYIISRFFQRKSHRKMFLNNLVSLNKSLKAQEKAFLTTIKSLKFEENNLWNYDKVDFFQLSAIKEMSYKESFNSFFYGFENQISICIGNKLRRKSFNRAWSIFSNTEFWSTKAIADFYSFTEKYNNYGDKRNSVMHELHTMWESLLSVSTTNISDEHYQYLIQLGEIISEFGKIPTAKRVTPYITHRKLILRIRILNRKHFTLPFMREFNDKCLEVSAVYIDMEHLVRHSKAQYKVYYYSFRTFNRSLKKIIQILE